MGLGSVPAQGNEHDGRAELLKELKSILYANSKLKELISRYEIPSNSGAEPTEGCVETLAARAEAAKSLLSNLHKLQEGIGASGAKIESQISEISAQNDQLLAIVEALRESEEKFRVLSETSPAAIFLYQGDLLIYANEAAERFTGYTREEMLKKNYWDMVHPQYKEMVKSIGIARLSGKQVPTRYEVQYITRSGEVRWAEFAAGMIEYRRKPAGIVIAFDITDRKLAEAALQESKAQAEMYVDLMGHDINNLNQIALGYLELAMEHLAQDQKSMEYLSKPIEALEKSSKLIEKVKKLQLMRSGQLEPMSIDVGAVIEEAIKMYSHVPDRDVTINFKPSPALVKADELLIEIFSNLVLNAIKHSPCDKPLIIDIGTSRISRAGKDYYKVMVEDNGPGIPDEKKVSIFGRFSKGSNRIKGSGLGLYLVKSLAESYGGEVWVEDRVPSDYTKGSRFVVILPAAGE